MQQLFLLQHHDLQLEHQQLLRVLVLQHHEHQRITAEEVRNMSTSTRTRLINLEEIEAETFEVEDVSDPDLLLGLSSCTSCASTSCCSTTSCALCSCMNPWN